MDMGQIQAGMDFFAGTPLYLLLSAILVGFGIYYFWKVAPKRYQDYKKISEENAKTVAMFDKVCSQYDRALENSSRVVENNTAALQATQSMLELNTAKIDKGTDEIAELVNEMDKVSNSMNETKIELIKMRSKMN